MPRIDKGDVYRLICTCLGIGYIRKGGGTVAAVVCCIGWYFAWRGGNEPVWLPLLMTLGLFFVGVHSAGKVEAEWGKDSYRVVIDEVAGMCLTLLFVPVRWPYLLAGLVLFRFFDISKPFYIRKMENLKGGWGVMMDDVLAGVYANLLLQLVVFVASFVKIA
ncbi:MAG TPA: phosphatidylglycerophosphatase A [Puia sp.]|nr:phosphatidylglycerophosphatase A [Puia sp.]